MCRLNLDLLKLLLLNHWLLDWAEIFLVCNLRCLVVCYLLSFCYTSRKQLHRLYSNLLKLLLLNHSRDYIEIFRSCTLVVHYLSSFCRTTPKLLHWFNSNLLKLLFFNCSTDWAEICRVYPLRCLVLHSMSRFCKNFLDFAKLF